MHKAGYRLQDQKRGPRFGTSFRDQIGRSTPYDPMLALSMDCSRHETALFRSDKVEGRHEFGILVLRLVTLRVPNVADTKLSSSLASMYRDHFTWKTWRGTACKVSDV